jgi:hypothetical protein
MDDIKILTKPPRKLTRGGPNFHGKPGKSGRKSLKDETAMVAAFGKVVTPRKFEQMTRSLLAMFESDATKQYEKNGTTYIEPVIDANTRARIWEKIAAYAMGEPVKREESGRIGELAEYLDQLIKDGEEMGESVPSSEDIQRDWVQTPSLN